MRVAGRLLAALLLAGVAPAVAAQVDGREGAERLPELRARWAEKSPEERRTLRERYEALRRMRPEERAELERRARRLGALEERLLATASSQLLSELADLPPPERQARQARYLRERLREIGRRMRSKMPPDLLRELERAQPLERVRILEHFRDELLRLRGSRAILEVSRELGLSEAETARLASAPVEERSRVLRHLRRRQIVLALERNGVADGIPAETWSRWKSLPDEDFLERLRGLEIDERPGG